MRVLSTSRSSDSRLFIIGTTEAEFVVQVTDRHSVILDKHVAETLVWPFRQLGKAAQGINSAEGAFHAVAHGNPLLRLPIASVDAAVEVVGVLTAALSDRSPRGVDDVAARAGVDPSFAKAFVAGLAAVGRISESYRGFTAVAA